MRKLGPRKLCFYKSQKQFLICNSLGSEAHLGKPVLLFKSQFSSKCERVKKEQQRKKERKKKEHTTLPRWSKYERLLAFQKLPRHTVNSLRAAGRPAHMQFPNSSLRKTLACPSPFLSSEVANTTCQSLSWSELETHNFLQRCKKIDKLSFLNFWNKHYW